MWRLVLSDRVPAQVFVSVEASLEKKALLLPTNIDVWNSPPPPIPRG